MTVDSTMLRLFVSQAIALYFILVLIPLKAPRKQNILIIVSGAIVITFINALLIINFGLLLYVRFYILTLVLPYVTLFSFFVVYKGAKFIFALLSIQVIGNVAIINGLLASYIFYGQDSPFVDLIARTITYVIFLPIFFKFIRPTYLKMAEKLNKGWWIVNLALILSYALAYFVLFVPNSIFHRPEYFIHAYIGTILSLLIYAIIYFLFFEIQSKINIEHDKQQLSIQVTSLAAQSAEITTIAYKDSLTGLNNRYSLFRQMDLLIENKQAFLVIFIDLDNLKEINDTYNHSKGDTYLIQFGLAIHNAVKDQGEVYRFAGDEFVCLIRRDFGQFSSDEFKKSIINQMIIDVPFNGLSLGLAYYPKDGSNADDLINLADQSMYAEKKTKENRL